MVCMSISATDCVSYLLVGEVYIMCTMSIEGANVLINPVEMLCYSHSMLKAGSPPQ